MSRDCTGWAWSVDLKPATLKLILLNLADRADNDGYECFPSIDRIVSDTGLNKKTVQAGIHKLIEMNMLSDTGRRVGKMKRVRVLKLHPEIGNVPENGNNNNTENGNNNVPEIGTLNQSVESVTINQSDNTHVSDIFDHWVAVMQKANNTKLTPDRRQKINARLKTYTVDELKQAIDGCKLSDFHMGKNDRNEMYNDLATIMKNDSVTDKHIQRAKTGVTTDQPPHPLASQIVDAYNATVSYHKIMVVTPGLLKNISNIIETFQRADDINTWIAHFRLLNSKYEGKDSTYIAKHNKLEGMTASADAFGKSVNDANN